MGSFEGLPWMDVDVQQVFIGEADVKPFEGFGQTLHKAIDQGDSRVALFGRIYERFCECF